MLKWLILFLFTLSTCFAAPSFRPDRSLARFVTNGQIYCSGVVVDEGVLTAKHCIIPGAFVCASDECFPVVDVEMGKRDWAIVRTPISLGKARKLSKRLHNGDEVTAYGYPSGSYWQAWGRVVDAYSGYIDMPVEPGFSGGPVLKNGKVVGIISSVRIVRNPFTGLPDISPTRSAIVTVSMIEEDRR